MSATLVERLVARDPRAVARALSTVLDREAGAPALVAAIHPHTGRAAVVGITGPPGVGKSTLVDRLTVEYRRSGHSVGVLAVDPSSPFTGGALLGDRVRMQGHALDSGVFIRSLATRGRLGGLARSTGDAVMVLDAAGFDVVIVETVGVGQDEVDIAGLADVAVVVLAPGAGDEVQALKAGIMEIADVFVVNKADTAGADRTAAAIEAAQALGGATGDAWRPPVLRTIAVDGTGVPELLEAIELFRSTSAGRDDRRMARARHRVEEAVSAAIWERVVPERLEAHTARVASRAVDPFRAAAEIVGSALGASSSATPDSLPVLDHVAVAVEDSVAILAFLATVLDASSGPPEDVADQGVRVRFVSLPGPRIEIIEPLGPGSPVTRFLQTRGPGLHHVAFRVADLPGTLAVLQARGVRLIDASPRRGADGASVAFVHPSGASGVLVELIAQEPDRRAVR